MSNTIEKYLDLHQIEQLHKIRVDLLRKYARTGKLRTIRVGGKQGPHLVHQDDLEIFLKKYRESNPEREITGVTNA